MLSQDQSPRSCSEPKAWALPTVQGSFNASSTESFHHMLRVACVPQKVKNHRSQLTLISLTFPGVSRTWKYPLPELLRGEDWVGKQRPLWIEDTHLLVIYCTWCWSHPFPRDGWSFYPPLSLFWMTLAARKVVRDIFVNTGAVWLQTVCVMPSLPPVILCVVLKQRVSWDWCSDPGPAASQLIRGRFVLW